MGTDPGINLPTEIKWEQLCVSRDMMDLTVSAIDNPPKWNSSIALSRYVPEEDYQNYPGRKVTYLKVTCSITGYQAKSDEIEGRIDWDSFNTRRIAYDELDRLLAKYYPCTGAIIQVTVAPREGSNIPIDRYPYIMDFQPKKRDLYETASDTTEQSSRSLDSLSVKKAAGTTTSNEVLDIDRGTSVGGGASTFGFGANFNYARQGEWGTRRMTTENSTLERTSDESREKREGQSHTTQISQLYHLLDSYHIGTNRAIFFVQPRPHTLEVSSGFVRGPRKIEGIQEFFMVVNQPSDQPDFCTGIRLDTGHLLPPDLPPYYGNDRPPQDLFITTRALRCCPLIPPTPSDEGIVGAWEVSKVITPISHMTAMMNPINLSPEKEKKEVERIETLHNQGMMTPKEANHISNFIRETMFSSLVSKRREKPGKIFILDLPIVSDVLKNELSKTVDGNKILDEPISAEISKTYLKMVADFLKKNVKDLTRRDVLDIDAQALIEVIGTTKSEITKLRLALLGVPIKN